MKFAALDLLSSHGNTYHLFQSPVATFGTHFWITGMIILEKKWLATA